MTSDNAPHRQTDDEYLSNGIGMAGMCPKGEPGGGVRAGMHGRAVGRQAQGEAGWKPTDRNHNKQLRALTKLTLKGTNTSQTKEMIVLGPLAPYLNRKIGGSDG